MSEWKDIEADARPLTDAEVDAVVDEIVDDWFPDDAAYDRWADRIIARAAELDRSLPAPPSKEVRGEY